MKLFISDLHLDNSRRLVAEAFFSFLEEHGGRAQALYILGDLFELWIGDDDDDRFARDVKAALARFAASGSELYVMRGNRDFLFSDKFAADCGAQLLEDPTLVEAGKQKILLMHGDTLCTDDTDYQRFRAQVRSPAWINGVMAKSLDERRALGRQIREQSSAMNSRKAADIMDVNEDAVIEAFRQHGVSTLIHGHTHRPGRHIVMVDGKPRERIVLGDWDDHAWSYCIDGDVEELKSWPL